MVVARRGGCGGSCADVSAGASWLLIPTCNGGAGTSMVAAGVAGEGGVRDGAVGFEKKMVARVWEVEGDDVATCYWLNFKLLDHDTCLYLIG